MDNNKVSHIYDNFNTIILDIIDKKFGNLARKIEKNHMFLGMNIEFIESKKLAITTQKYIEEAIEYFKEEMKFF